MALFKMVMFVNKELKISFFVNHIVSSSRCIINCCIKDASSIVALRNVQTVRKRLVILTVILLSLLMCESSSASEKSC